MRSNPLLELQGIYKSFGGVDVLQNIHLNLHAGEVHVLLGENGAGKSTLIKLLTGAHAMDNGQLLWQGEVVQWGNPQEAMKCGIACIYQELNLIPELTVCENIFLGRELKHARTPFLNLHTMKEKAITYMKKLGLNVSPETTVSSLGMGEKQLVEIARALSMDAKLIIMDEPTSSLSDKEAEHLLTIVMGLKQQGIAILYVSHKLEELKKVGDRISILRDGGIVGTYEIDEITIDQMIQLMVGRNLKEKYPKVSFPIGNEGFRVENFQLTKQSPQINFSAYKGQILGIAGLVGAGRTELVRGIFGAEKRISGEISIFGEKVELNSPREALKAGLALIPENRKEEGLLLDQSVEFNLTLTTLFDKYWLNKNYLEQQSLKYIDQLEIHPKDSTKRVGRLSGGNQQKVAIAKWLATNAKVYLFDEPTRGIDVGAKVHVYQLLNRLVEQGAIVIVVSSDLPEIIGICDRVLVMKEGQITADLLTKETSQEEIMAAATGGILCPVH